MGMKSRRLQLSLNVDTGRRKPHGISHYLLVQGDVTELRKYIGADGCPPPGMLLVDYVIERRIL